MDFICGLVSGTARILFWRGWSEQFLMTQEIYGKKNAEERNSNFCFFTKQLKCSLIKWNYFCWKRAEVWCQSFQISSFSGFVEISKLQFCYIITPFLEHFFSLEKLQSDFLFVFVIFPKIQRIFVEIFAWRKKVLGYLFSSIFWEINGNIKKIWTVKLNSRIANIFQSLKNEYSKCGGLAYCFPCPTRYAFNSQYIID